MEIVNEKKKIGREKGREKVRNDEGGEVMDKIVKWMIEILLSIEVERNSRLVEKEDRRIIKDREGNWKKMELEEGKMREKIKEKSVVELDFGEDEVMRRRRIGGGVEIIMSRIGEEKEDIVIEREVEK